MSFKDKLEKNLIWWSLAMILAGFLAGAGSYKFILEVANQTTITKDTFITKDELSKNYILKEQSVKQIGADERYIPKELCATRQPMKVTQEQSISIKKSLDEGKQLRTISGVKLAEAYFQWYEKTLSVLRKIGSTEDLRFAYSNEYSKDDKGGCQPRSVEQYRVCLNRGIGILEGLVSESEKT